MKVACIGMGWWSDVLADAIKRSGKLSIAGCYSRSADKREKFAAKYGCRAYASYEALLDERSIEGVINTTPNATHLETTRAAAQAGKHVFLDKPIANTIADARAITEACREACVVLALAAGPQRWTAMEGGCPIMAGSECIGGIGVAGGNWEFDENVAREAALSIQ